MFVAIFMDDFMRNRGKHMSAWLGIVAAGVCLSIFGADQFIVPTMVCILVVLYLSTEWRAYEYCSTDNNYIAHSRRYSSD